MMISLTLTFALLLLLSLTLTHAIKTGVDELRCRCECEDDDLSPHNPSIDGTECNEAAEQACATTCAGDDGCGSNKLLSSKCLGTETVCDLAAGVSLTASLDCIKELNPACALPQNFIGPDVNQTLLCECHANGHQCTAKSPCTVGTAEEADCLADGCSAEQCAPPEGTKVVQPKKSTKANGSPKSNGESPNSESDGSSASILSLHAAAAAILIIVIVTFYV